MLGKKLINSGPTSSGANTFASENFNTVLYTGNGGTQRIGGYINRGAVFNGSSSVIQVSGLNQFFNNWNDASWSAWINTTDTSAQYIACESTDSQNYKLIGAIGSNKFQIVVRRSGVVYSGTSTTTMNDGNWHHIVATYQSSTGTVKGYIDGSEEISFSTGGTSSATFSVYDFCIGANKQNSNIYNPLDGKIDQFRVFNKVLSSSEVTTLYGETFASTTISTTDIFEDNSGIALHQFEGNANDSSGYSNTEQQVTINSNSSSHYFAINHTDTTGKFYFEVDYKTTQHSTLMVGLYSSGHVSGWTNLRSRSYYGSNGGKYQGGTQISYGSTFTVGDIIGVAFDATNNTIEFFKNGTSQGTAFSGNDADNSMGIQLSTGYYGETASLLLNSSDWNYSAPTGFGEWTGSITALNNGNYTTSGSSFAVVTTNYNGTASNVTYQEATRFQPDLVWIKARKVAASHQLFDSIRGVSKVISSESTSAESDLGSYGLTAFNSNGFSVSDIASGGNGVNGASGGTYSGTPPDYVAWCFNAGSGSSASNTDGINITSTVKANIPAGFSIVRYTSDGSSSSTVGHGLGSDVRLILQKRLNGVQAPYGITDIITGSPQWLQLSSSVAASNITSNFPMTNSVFGNWEGNGQDTINYCFADVAGYQKIGTYNGDGSTSGHYIETGFEPAFLMIKGASHGGSWAMLDNKRSTTNPRDEVIYADSSGAEGGNDVYVKANFLTNGFELKTNDSGINMSGRTYIYLAIAADPDQTDPTVENSFDVVTYTGNRPSTQDIEVDFKPDLIWIKNRDSGSYPHVLTDSVRGNTKYLESNSTISEQTATTGITSFNDNGFSLGANGYFNGGASGANNDMVAWCWKAGDHDDNLPQINTEGTIDSIVSVNDAAGFSIVNYIGNGTSGATIGTGLSSAPELMIVKRTDTASDWDVYTSATGATKSTW